MRKNLSCGLNFLAKSYSTLIPFYLTKKNSSESREEIYSVCRKDKLLWLFFSSTKYYYIKMYAKTTLMWVTIVEERKIISCYKIWSLYCSKRTQDVLPT